MAPVIAHRAACRAGIPTPGLSCVLRRKQKTHRDAAPRPLRGVPGLEPRRRSRIRPRARSALPHAAACRSSPGSGGATRGAQTFNAAVRPMQLPTTLLATPKPARYGLALRSGYTAPRQPRCALAPCWHGRAGCSGERARRHASRTRRTHQRVAGAGLGRVDGPADCCRAARSLWDREALGPRVFTWAAGGLLICRSALQAHVIRTRGGRTRWRA